MINNEGAGATGRCQALPGSKMASAGPGYLINPVAQLRWGNSYAVYWYGSWAGPYAAELHRRRW